MAKSSIKSAGPGMGSMVERHPKLPDQIRYFELELDTTKPRAGFRIRNSGIQNVLGTSHDHAWANAHSKLRDAIDADEIPSKRAPTFDRRNGPGQKRRYSISLNNPREVVSGGHKYPESEICIFAFRLFEGEGPSQVNWRFSSTFSPFSIGDREVLVGGECLDLENIFSHATHCRTDNIDPIFEHPDKEERDWRNPYNSSNWAYFVYDCAEAIRLIKNENFVLRYNLHVEIEDLERRNHFIPIIIDPDIGHPGGNQSGP